MTFERKYEIRKPNDEQLIIVEAEQKVRRAAFDLVDTLEEVEAYLEMDGCAPDLLARVRRVLAEAGIR
jgi:hypothetical protein